MYKDITRYFNKDLPVCRVHSSEERTQQTGYFRALSEFGITLNPAQQEAVKTTEGPVLIVAGAGSGKTTVLTTRIGYMISECRIDPKKILLITFTKKAAVEMTQRLNYLPGVSTRETREVTSGTYHSICLKILRDEGYDFSVLHSERRQHLMIKSILKRYKLDNQYSPEDVVSVISYWKNQLCRPQDIEPINEIMAELKKIYISYENMKENEGLFDFDDMLLETYYLLLYNPLMLEKYQKRFNYILCDEFQDSSLLQYEIIKMLSDKHKNLCIVGDDAQTIYSWRSASAQFMLDFHLHYPNCKKVIMDINYRSTSNIIGISNSLIGENEKQIKKNLQSVNFVKTPIYFNSPDNSDVEAEDIVREIQEKRSKGASLKDMAVIYRTHATGRAIFEKLLLADIPFITYGKSKETFYDNSFVKPIIFLLQALIDPSDVGAIVHAAPIFYISRIDMERAIDHVVIENSGETPKDLFTKALVYVAMSKKDFQQTSLLSKIEALKEIKKQRPALAIKTIRAGVLGYEKQLEVDGRKSITIHKEMLIEMLDELEQASRYFEDITSFINFIEKVKEKNRQMEELRKNPDIEAVRLMTIHASKGLEFDTVFAIGWAEGILPHSSALDGEKSDTNLSDFDLLEEERRLAYVTLTRAKTHLYLSAPMMHRGRACKDSRFLEECFEAAGTAVSS